MKKIEMKIKEIKAIISDIESILCMLVDSSHGIDAYNDLIKLRLELETLENKMQR